MMGTLDALLAPRSVAVIGASRDPAKWGRRALDFTSRAGFAGSLYGVNPAVSRDASGVRFVPDLASIPERVDLAVIARPAAVVPEVVEECASASVRAVLITASGFGELGSGGRAAELALRAVAGRTGMRILGPNTFGLFVSGAGLNLTPRESIPPGDIALVSQSGNVGVAMYGEARRAGFGFSACVGVGNQIDVGCGELLAHFAADEATRAIGLYVEGIPPSGARDLRAGLAACRKAGRPVAVLKAGRSAEGAGAAATHTGTLAADDRIWRSVLAEHGAVQVGSTQDMADALAVLGRVPTTRGRVLVLADGGGDAVLTADAISGAGLTAARPSADGRAALDALAPPHAPRTPTRNPVTLDTAGGFEDDPLVLARCARAGAADPDVDVIVAAGLLGGYPRIREGELACVDELIAIRDGGTPILVQTAFAVDDPEPVTRLKDAGIPVFPTSHRLAAALATTMSPDVTQTRPHLGEPPLSSSLSAGSDGFGARGGGAARAGAPTPATGPLMLVSDLAGLLRGYGIALPRIVVVADKDELAAESAATSYPACVKLADPAVSHKSDVGGVRLGLADAAGLMSAGRDLWASFPGAPLLVMPMLPAGVELIVGTGSDAVFGPFVLVGRGGIWAESDPDTAVRLAPVGADAAVSMLRSLRCAPMLTGGRGQRASDLAALGELVAAMSRLAVDHPELSVEMNPVIAGPHGYGVADLRAARGT